MTRKLLAFAGILLVLWAVVSFAAFCVAGMPGIGGSTVAALINGVPALGTLAFSLWASTQSANWQLAAWLVGILARMGVALGLGMTAYYAIAGFTFRTFLLWLVLYYFVSLVIEICFVVSALERNSSSHGR